MALAFESNHQKRLHQIGHAAALMVPIAAVLGIYARETGQGMIFSEADAPPPQPPTAPPEAPAGGPTEVKRAKPTLKVVK